MTEVIAPSGWRYAFVFDREGSMAEATEGVREMVEEHENRN